MVFFHRIKLSFPRDFCKKVKIQGKHFNQLIEWSATISDRIQTLRQTEQIPGF